MQEELITQGISTALKGSNKSSKRKYVHYVLSVII